MKPKLQSAILLALLGLTAAALAQQRATIEGTGKVQELGYKDVPNFFKFPMGEILGETQGIATNSKGHIFVYFRILRPGCGIRSDRENSSRRSARAIRFRLRSFRARG